MLGALSNRFDQWRKHRELLTVHEQTLDAYKRKSYPANPSIGIGAAYQQQLLEAHVLCQHSWIGHALHEGPIFLHAWHHATRQLKSQGLASYAPYLPQEALEAALGLFKNTWAKGWGDEDKMGESASMQVVRWVHQRDPYWIGRNLDTVFFSSSASVWDTLYFHDVHTAKWAIQQWPEKAAEQTIAWHDWLLNDAPWFFPMTRDSHAFSPTKWRGVAQHLATLSPNKDDDLDCKIKRAVEFLGDGRSYNKPADWSHRGLFWKAMTHGVPSCVAEPVGAALSCLWPGMEPDLYAIARHFNPNIETNLFPQDASPLSCDGVHPTTFSASGARATITLYEDPLLWANTFLQACGPALSEPAMVALPNDLLHGDLL